LEISHAYDARALVLSEKARRYDELMAGNKKDLPPIPPIRKPKPAPPVSKLEEAKSRAKRTGSIDDAIDVLYAQRRERAKR
jgi:hypothetical protein